MSLVPGFSWFDVIVVVIVLFFLARGLWIGFFRQLAALFALIGGYWLAAHYHGKISPFVERFIDNPKLIFLVSVVLIFLASVLVFTLLGKLLRLVMTITLMGWFDHLLGGVLGVIKAIIIASLLYMFVASSLSASNTMLKSSMSAPYLQLGAEYLQRWINDPRLREYFAPKKPAIQDPQKNKRK
ncbi:MAG: hypothetical protein CSA32_00475 [Desulfobulbus propionicus]|nr:MAG: hypothetical protein CSA32_00475 [Desulfobulbus propionicus]